jgi:hypothetical protein
VGAILGGLIRYLYLVMGDAGLKKKQPPTMTKQKKA